MNYFTQVILWIKEKKKYIDTELDTKQIVSLDDLKRKLQDWHTFQDEISANNGNIQNITQVCGT